ncbi:MAG: hypothetical protein HQK51_10425 [Oligoflexia bacterium]|nr:hypothetical protein [Oligoflexia bacterium]
MNKKYGLIIIVVSILLICFTSIGIFIMKEKRNDQSKLLFWTNSAPFSTDPMDYDAFIHHIVFRSTYSSMVTEYSSGGPTGILAKSWKASDDFKTWTLFVRDDVTFENGDKITPEIIVKSLTRIAYLLKKGNSETGLFNHMLGYESFNKISDKLIGIEYDSNSITLKFDRPKNDLLDIISFGLYGIAHPSDYDQVTGEWKDKKKFISSGSYKIIQWNKDSIVLQLRDDFLSTIGHKNKFKTIEITWDPNRKEEADAMDGLNIDLNVRNDLTFYGGAPSGIMYLRCISWTNPDSPFYQLSDRQKIRDIFYSEVEKAGFKPTRSFFPLIMKGIRDFKSGNVDSNVLANSKVKVLKHSSLRSIYLYSNPTMEALKNTGKNFNLEVNAITTPYDELIKEISPGLPSYKVDLAVLGTDIFVEQPEHDIRFMFLSKEGIQLPDAKGSIIAHLKKHEALDVQMINQELWDQAIIWPLTHYSSGFRAKDFVDVSILNVLKNPIDFMWVGHK